MKVNKQDSKVWVISWAICLQGTGFMNLSVWGWGGAGVRKREHLQHYKYQDWLGGLLEEVGLFPSFPSGRKMSQGPDTLSPKT